MDLNKSTLFKKISLMTSGTAFFLFMFLIFGPKSADRELRIQLADKKYSIAHESNWDKPNKLDEICKIIILHHEIPKLKFGKIYNAQVCFIQVSSERLFYFKNSREISINEILERISKSNKEKEPKGRGTSSSSE